MWLRREDMVERGLRRLRGKDGVEEAGGLFPVYGDSVQCEN